MSDSPQGTLFVNVVWGEAYARSYLELTVPSELFPGNLPQFIAQRPARYRLYTDMATRPMIENHPAWRKLGEFLPAEIAPMELLSSPGQAIQKHDLLNACHRHALRDAAAGVEAVSFLAPDVVWADGALGALGRMAQPGCRAVLIFSALFLEKEKFCPAYFRRFGEAGQTTAMNAIELISFALDYLHPEVSAFDWNNPVRPTWPAYLSWSAPEGKGLLVRSFHYHPLWVWPMHPEILPSTTIDGSYLLTACPDEASWKIIADPRELCVFEFSASAQRRLQIKPGKKDPVWLARWIAQYCDSLHRRLAGRPLRYARDASWPGWADLEAESGKVVQRALVLSSGRARPWQSDFWRYAGASLYDWQKAALKPLRLRLQSARKTPADSFK